MRVLRKWFGSPGRDTARPGPARGATPRLELDAALTRKRARYAELRTATAACLYRLHSLGGQATRHQAIGDRARDQARQALLVRDVPRSRLMVARARTALDLARHLESRRQALRADADTALAQLRALGEAIAALEATRMQTALHEAEHALSVLEAEEEIERELR